MTMRTRRLRLPAVALLTAMLLVGTVPLGTAIAAPGDDAGPVETTLEHLQDVLQRLEGELAALRAPKAERIENGLEEIIEVIEGLLREFEQPRDEGDPTAMRARIVRLDLMLHRLVYVLEEIVENAQDGPQRPSRDGARDALTDLGRWIDGYIDGLTAGLDPQVADRLDRAAHEMVRDLAGRIADMAKRAQGDNRPILARLVERLEDLLFRLDGFILDHVLVPPRREGPAE